MSEFLPDVTVTGEQIRAARALLRLDQRKFAAVCHITIGAVKRMEQTRGPITMAPNLLKSVSEALSDAGVELIAAGHYSGIGGPGVRLAGEAVIAEDVISFKETSQKLSLSSSLKQNSS